MSLPQDFKRERNLKIFPQCKRFLFLKGGDLKGFSAESTERGTIGGVRNHLTRGKNDTRC
jgi:hypothetical protein